LFCAIDKQAPEITDYRREKIQIVDLRDFVARKIDQWIFSEAWWAQLDLNQRPSDYALHLRPVFNELQHNEKTGRNSSRPVRTEKVAKKWPRFMKRRAL
jgi:hypothetical protein